MEKIRDALFLNNPIPMFLMSGKNKKITDINNAFKERFNTSSEIIGYSLQEITNPISSNLNPTVSSDISKEFLMLSLPKGVKTMIELSLQQLEYGNDPIFLGTINELFPPLIEKNSIQHPIFKSIFDKALDIILVADNEGRFTQVNETACRKLGYSRKELLKMDVGDITYKPIQSYKDKKWEDFLRTGIDKGKYLIQAKNGTVIHTEYRAIANIRPGQHLSILRDVSEIIHIEEELEASEGRFKHLLEAAPDAIFVVDQNGIIQYSNAVAENMMGYSEEELVGSSIDILVPEFIRKEHKEHRHRYTENPYKRTMGSNLELSAIRKDGTEVPVDIMLGPLLVNSMTHTLAVVRDISDYQKAQNNLRREQAFTKLLHDLTKIANEAKSLDEALEKSIQEICEFMDWPVGHAYKPVNDNSGEFYPADIWYLKNHELFKDFRNFTMGVRFSPGEGMIGHIIETGTPQWVKNTHEDPDFVRRLPDIDLHIRACFGFPIIVDNKIVGILEFFSSKVLEEDSLLLKKMATIGYQLGRVYERYNAEKMLKQSEQKYKRLFETSFDAILILSEEELIDCNKRAEELFQCSCDELKDNKLTSFFPPQQPSGILSGATGREKVNNAFRGEDQFFEWQFQREDGKYFDAEVSLINMHLNKKNHIQAIIRDITERKERERLLNENMKLFSQLFKNSPVGLVLLDKNLLVKEINESFQQIFGYQLEEIKGEKIDDILAPPELRNEARKITNRTMKGDSFQTEKVRLRKDGSEVPVLIATVPVEIEREIIAIFGIYIDISERKEVEQQLVEQLEEKRILLAEIHHRVKNNLAVVSGMIQLQALQEDDDSLKHKLKDSMSRIKTIAYIHELLYKSNSFSRLNLDENIKKLVREIAHTYQPSIEPEINFNLQKIDLNINQAIPASLIVNEVVTNAFKHAFDEMIQDKLWVTLAETNNTVSLQITDNGKGLPADFKVTDFTSSLGLQLINILTQQLEGNIKYESEDGKTHFTLTFEKKEAKGSGSALL